MWNVTGKLATDRLVCKSTRYALRGEGMDWILVSELQNAFYCLQFIVSNVLLLSLFLFYCHCLLIREVGSMVVSEVRFGLASSDVR